MRPLRPVDKKPEKVFLSYLLQFKSQSVLNFAFFATIPT